MGLFRIDPKLPVEAMQTYAISQPARTHSRPATCEEVSCLQHANGWSTLVDVSTELGRKQSYYIRTQSGRHWRMERFGTTEGFFFAPGQQCFRQHRVSVERDPLFLKVGGDWRGRTSEPTIMKPADWVDDFANHQDQIITLQERG